MSCLGVGRMEGRPGGPNDAPKGRAARPEGGLRCLDVRCVQCFQAGQHVRTCQSS